ncbi:MAG: hypothetical protein FJ087_23115, partial [Deltaproteobacteria bacterium]|nr:hypothetical protein [Deltaproteobacteria bacterium]
MNRLLPCACAAALLSVLPVPAPARGAAAGPYGLPTLPRADFNRLAARAGIPLHWTADDATPGTPDPAEVAVLGVPADRAAWVKGATFTPRFERAWRQIVEMRRLEAVRLELDRGFPTRVATDLSGLPAAEKDLVRRLLAAGERVDRLYRTQVGATALEPHIARADPESRALFERNHGPWCVAPGTEKDPFCNALPDFPARRWDAYPADEVHETALCERLAAHPDRAALMAPFAVVRRQGDGLAAVPLNQAYGREMTAIAKDLEAAAKAAGAAGGEEALSRYLLSAAGGFRTNDWADADEAWAAMNSTNSRWYLRVGPDEVGWDLCNEKAGFHLALARTDGSAIDMQGRLSALRDEMERSLAALIGAPYAARPVSFHMPDFIEVVYNAGDSRPALGGVLGQSLPNWGRVATEGRGRTVVMTNLYQDPDSRSV